MKKITLLLILVIFASCGTRKVQKSSIKEDTKTEQATTEKKDITSNKEINTVINDESNEIEVTPIDTSKVLIIGGKTFKNAKIKIIHKKINTTIAKKETVQDLSTKQTKSLNVSKSQSNTKVVERKSNPFLPLLWLLIPASIYLVWKYKFKIMGLWV